MIVGEHAALTLDSAGMPVVAYFDLPGFDLRVLHCDDVNCAGDESANISIPDPGPASTGQYNAIALDGAGRPVVSFLHSVTGSHIGLGVLHCDDANCAGDESANITLPDTQGHTGFRSSIELDASGNPVITYLGGGELRVLHCDDPDCAGDETPNVTTPTPAVVHYLDGKLDDSGNPVVAFTDASSLYLMHCDDGGCAGDESGNISVVDSGDYDYLAIALDTGGNPVIAYWAATSADLKVVHCDDPVCAGDESANTNTPDALPSTIGSNDQLSIAVDGSGNPVVAYPADGVMRVLHCDDPVCAGDESANTFDAAIGTMPSLALDGAGNPVVAFWGNLGLRVLHCGSPDCIPDPEPTHTPGPATDTPTASPPTETLTPAPTDTPTPSPSTTPTPTSTQVPPTSTPTASATGSPVPTATVSSDTPPDEPPTATPTTPEVIPTVSEGAPPAADGAQSAGDTPDVTPVAGDAGAGITVPNAGSGSPSGKAHLALFAVLWMLALGLACLDLGRRRV
jgi:hypothetical protein